MNVTSKDIIECLNKHEAPSIKHPTIDEAERYTRFLNKLRQSAAVALNFEKHNGFGRDYPGSPMIDKNFSLTDEEMVVLNKLKDKKPFKAGPDEYLNILQETYIDLANAHNHVAPAVRHDGNWDNHSSGSSYYTPHIVFLTGPKSLIVALHEYIHSIGFGEVVATWWSTNVFRLLYPKSFEKLKISRFYPHLMRRNVNPDLEVNASFVARKNIREFKFFLEEEEQIANNINNT